MLSYALPSFSPKLLPLLTLAMLFGKTASQDTGFSNGIVGSCSPQFFSQRLDHRGTISNSTFYQRYSISTQYYKPGGPIIFLQGAENAEFLCPEGLIVNDWAKSTNGVLATLEHRFFGTSLPFGNDSFTTENMRDYLTLDNVLADSATFIESVKKNITGAQEAKVVVLGGSYGGTISALLRTNYPDTFTGAVSSAGAVRGYGPPLSDQESYLALQYVSDTFMRHSPEAAIRIAKSLQQVSDVFNSSQQESLQESLSLCSTPPSSDKDFLLHWMAEGIALVPQFSFSNSSLRDQTLFNYSKPATNDTTPFEAFIESILAEPSPMASLNKTLWTAYGFQALTDKKSCLNYTISSIDSSTDGVQAAPFLFISCTYFTVPRLEFISPNSSIFQPSPPGSVEAYAQSCKQQYGMEPLNATALAQKFKFTKEDLQNSTRILFTENELDINLPHGPDMNWFTGNGSRIGNETQEDLDRTLVYVIEGSGHTEDTIAPDHSNTPAMKAAHNFTLERVKAWTSGSHH